MVILQAIQDFGNWFWGIPILILIGGGGLFLTIYLGFPQIRHFGYAMSQTFGKMFAKKQEGKVRPISAAFAALACAVGASNIVGVPVAIALGGPGAVFWIWILAIFGMCTKYCEVAMGIKYRRKNDVGEWVGGPAYYLRGLGKKIGVVFGIGYAFFFMIELVPSLASQGVSAAEQFNVFGANQTVTGIIIAVLVGVILAGGFKRVSSVTDILVPVMACLYVLGALVIIFANVGELPAVIGMIFEDAFTGRAAVGGFAFGVLQFMFDGGFAIGWQSIVGDYLVAFTVLGLAGLVARRKSGVFTGTLIAGFSRFLVHYVVGATVWAEYMPETFFGMTMHSPWFYSLLYNLAYMLPNIAITLLVFAVAYKPLKKYFTASDLLPSPAAAQPVKDPTSPKWDPER